jgi:spore coat protein H
MNRSSSNIYILVSILFFLGLTKALFGQIVHPDPGFIYDDSSLPRIDITIPQEDLDALYIDPWSDVEYKAQFSFDRDGTKESFAEIGLRLRGNTSRNKEKKSFRVSFNTFTDGGEFFGLEKMNLNAEVNDPSMVRSKLSWTVFRKLGIASVRSNHVLLYINSQFHGVYINTEHIDECFLNSRFGTNDGNLYKCTYPADLDYLGENPENYKIGEKGDRVYDLKTNTKWDDYGDLADFISTIFNYSADEFLEEIEKVMNVQQYLKIIAGDIMTANWDGYIGNKNNYYLYRDQVTGRIEYIPYDLDNTWGLDWMGVDWTQQSIYAWAREDRSLYDKIMQQALYRNQFTGYVKELAAYIISDELIQEVLRWRSQISPWVKEDPYYSLDFGYSYSDFLNALSEGIPDKWWLPLGVMEYANLRASSALDECAEVNAPPLFSHVRVDPTPKLIRVDWTVEDDQNEFTSTLHYRLDEEEWQFKSPLEPAHTDTISGRETFLDSISVPEGSEQLEIYFTASDKLSQESRYPAETIKQSFPLTNGPLQINEFLASNSTTLADDFGEYDDWVEIYNPTSSRVWLGSLFLSDKMGSPGKYKFPFEYLESEAFYLVWLDGQPEQGEDHAPFRMNSGGEKLRLSNRPAEGYTIIDSVTFGLQATDVAMGRSEDGSVTWIAFNQPTPGFPNLSTSRDEYLSEKTELVIYPNPSTNGVIYFNTSVSGTIYDVNGKAVRELRYSTWADVQNLVPGIYLLKLETGDVKRFIVARSR